MASHVPGGVGVFEGLMVLLLKPFLIRAVAAGARRLPVVYYLLPLGRRPRRCSSPTNCGSAARRRRASARSSAALTEQLTPRCSAFTFFSGLVLLFSGATPAAPGRLELLDRVLPLGVVEASHFSAASRGWRC